MNRVCSALCFGIITVVLALILDAALFYLIPLPGVVLNPNGKCNINETVVGCAIPSEGTAFVRYPSYSNAFHEYLHLKYGLGETIPMIGNISIFTLLALLCAAGLLI